MARRMSGIERQRMADEAVELIKKGLALRPGLTGDLTKRVGAEEALERERAARGRRRSRALAVLGATCAALALAAGGFWLYRARSRAQVGKTQALARAEAAQKVQLQAAQAQAQAEAQKAAEATQKLAQLQAVQAQAQAAAQARAQARAAQEARARAKAQARARSRARNPAGIEWIRIPGGSFMMGTNNDDSAGDFSDAKPVHRVTVPSFYMSKTLVTNKQYQSCVSAGACTPNSDQGSAFDGDNQPVVGVDWNQARTFAQWAGGRLPSESEWEYAARSAGKDRKYPWGDGDPCSRAVISGCGQNTQATARVCSMPSGNTEQGLCDMAGNAWEWVEDWYHGSYNGAPTDGSAWVDPAGSFRVNRGGSWNYGASGARAAFRGNGVPGFRDYYLGFRVAR